MTTSSRSTPPRRQFIQWHDIGRKSVPCGLGPCIPPPMSPHCSRDLYCSLVMYSRHAWIDLVMCGLCSTPAFQPLILLSNSFGANRMVSVQIDENAKC